MSNGKSIHFDSISRCFRTEARGEVWALRDFSLKCSNGEFLCLLGPSGCGKTTLLRIAAGLDKPTLGRIIIDDNEINGPQKDVGFISQEGDLLPWRTALNNVALGLEIQGMGKPERQKQAHLAIQRVGLPEDVAWSYAHELSGGMRQRVALARALCMHSQCLLADEPFGRLDEPTRRQLQSELLDLWRSDGHTIIFVTHSIEEAVFLADRIVIMSEGGMIADLPVKLERPRDRLASDFVEVMRQIRSRMNASNGSKKNQTV